MSARRSTESRERQRREIGQGLPGLKTIKRYIIYGWVRDQRGHHARTAGRKHQWHRQGPICIVSLFGLKLIVTVFHWLDVGGDTGGLTRTPSDLRARS